MRPRRIFAAVFRDAIWLLQKNDKTVSPVFETSRIRVRKIEMNVFPFPGGPDIHSRLDGATLQA